MRKIWIVAKREYKAAVLTKAFIISVALMPLLMGGSILAETLLKGVGAAKERVYVVIDRSPEGKYAKQLEAAVVKRNERDIIDPETQKATDPIWKLEILPPSPPTPEAILEQRFEVSERIRKGEVRGLLEIGADVATPNVPSDPKVAQKAAKAVTARGLMAANLSALFPNDAGVVRFQSDNALSMEFPNWARAEIGRSVFLERTTASQVPPEKVLAAAVPVPLIQRELARRDASGALVDGDEISIFVKFMVPFGIVMLMFMMVMVGAPPLMSGVIEEKMQRIAEVLLGSLPPFGLMLGKLIGSCGVALTLSAVYLTGTWLAAQHYGFANLLTPQVMTWFVAYTLLAVFMFGSVFIAIGAACTDTKEAQTLMGPVMVIVCLPLFVMTNIIQEPDSAFAVGASLFPLATPMLMTARMAILPNLPWWQPVAGIVGVLLTTLLFVYAASRIFRVGILLQGKGANFIEMGRWIFRG
ncbi:MAG TPA: ABC transporter permease [Gemmatales bacterium]|nr:ABC transporter permease [Gemmatales bacterium]HMP60493.1 ABC transporter permease [Gemmatales bacterium]